MPGPTTRSSSGAADAASDAVADLARRHPEVVAAARVGWVAKGVVYVVLGLLAATLVVGGGGGGGSDQEVSQSGAIQELASTPLGTLGLWLVAIGLALHVLWRLASVALPAESSAKVWATRAAYVVSALTYAALAWSAVTLATGGSSGGSGDQESQVDSVTRSVMEMTAGRWIVGLAGLAVLAVGAVFIHRGWTESFAEELEPGGVGPVDQRSLRRMGVVGWVARGVMMLIVGWFVVQAAIQFSPDEAQGIDGALRDATSTWWGSLLVAVVALGLVVYGAYCALSAPRTRLTSPG
ncbi:DUF1206 domain-containing protein [Actinomarinicola tropica]|uniref:DUF1206 domain-containing protein n=1 Tax=Actinomarinicola tropica TaxID=2789776 RepID=A0A5Q2RIA1_9ACTN|nr:DUF1206 domain-containing protein [Actinomarinicola tropica]QGG96519.1 DUF1206 domain-containing protein [Actinomarinicola tropica]